MTALAEDDGAVPLEPGFDVTEVLEAIDHLLDVIETLDAPITRELLRTAMMALVQECKLQESPARAMH